jgi:hypothetical protein
MYMIPAIKAVNAAHLSNFDGAPNHSFDTDGATAFFSCCIVSSMRLTMRATGQFRFRRYTHAEEVRDKTSPKPEPGYPPHIPSVQSQLFPALEEQVFHLLTFNRENRK